MRCTLGITDKVEYTTNLPKFSQNILTKIKNTKFFNVLKSLLFMVPDTIGYSWLMASDRNYLFL